MKELKILLIAFGLVVFAGCSSMGGNDEKTKTADNTAMTASEEGKPIYLTYETFKEKVWDFEKNPQEWVYEGDEPCIIDFYADWCQPCKKIAPIMEELAAEYKGKVKIYKVDTQNEKELARVFQIRSIPAILFSPVAGKPMMQTGAYPKDMYVKVIEENLLKSKETSELK
ncbi:MAG: thioredoxin domain-containing protein [Bacteroidota bacterium]|nr:thioredoxin domain-containing protein [Bacteroidota bacterium]